jgi:uncharacterized protein YdbL (DUF1318 family)
VTGRLLRLAAAALLAAASAAGAQTPALDSARLAGAIGERYDGYVGIAGAVSPAVRSHVSRVNIQRRSLYTQLAAAKGVSPGDVGIAAACQLLARVGPGEAYMLPDGTWRRRLPGQGAPVPSYCR